MKTLLSSLILLMTLSVPAFANDLQLADLGMEGENDFDSYDEIDPYGNRGQLVDEETRDPYQGTQREQEQQEEQQDVQMQQKQRDIQKQYD